MVGTYTLLRNFRWGALFSARTRRGAPNQLRQGEKFSGLLIGLLSGTLSATEARFKAMNAALKQQVEQNDTQKNAPSP